MAAYSREAQSLISAPISVRATTIAIIVLSLNFGVVFFDRNAVGFLVPFLQADLKLSNTQIGGLAAALAFSWALSGYVIGHLVDRHGRRKLALIAATLVFSLSSFISGLAWSFMSLFVARLAMGFAEGGVLPVSQSLTTRLVSERRRGLAMGMMQAFGSNLFGAMLAPVVLIALATHFGWRMTFYLTAIPGLSCVALIAWLVPDPGDPAQGRADGTRDKRVVSLFRRNVVLCCVIASLLVAYNSTCWYFVPLFLTKVRGLSTAEMGWLVAVLGLSAVVTSMPVPALSDRWGRKPVMILFALLGAIMPLSALALPASFAVLAVPFFVGWTVLGIFPIFMAIIPVETVGMAGAARALGLVVGCGELIGGALGPIGAGIVADHTNQSAPLWIMAGLSLGAAVVSLFVRETAPRRRRRG